MTSTANRRRKVFMPMDIKKKFAAAICMLLIAAIMMISSTYAWFTLSTAPEVTGITTNVGANGNLEIALLTPASFASNADDLGIKTAVGDSMEIQDKKAANVTWGNLVDLSDASYGLGNIILNPAALNLKTTDNTKADRLSGQIIQSLTSTLLAPNYGADGRVINVQKQTAAGMYDNGKFAESQYAAGVRAIGVSSGITVRVSTYRAALAAITVYMNGAKSAAQRSLVNNGQNLASMLVGVAADPNYALTEDDAAAVNNMKTALADAVESVANAIRQAALAKYLSAEGVGATALTDTQVTEKAAAFAAVDLTAANPFAAIADDVDMSFLDAVIAKYNTVRTNIAGISTAEAGMKYNDVEGLDSADGLMDRDHVTINGTAGTSVNTDNIGELASAIIGDGQVEVTMLDGSGIYADIANMVGNYTASGLNITISYNGISVNNMPTVMTTAVTGTSLLTTASTTAAGGDPTTSGGATAIDDTYGYMLDFGFRTNASGSNLLLQQKAAQRIYSDSEADLTQGAGTYIEFTTADRNVFTKDDVTALMSAVRVVFLTPNDTNDGYEILAVAAPNAKTEIQPNGERQVVKADNDIDGTYSYAESEVDASTTVKSELYLFDLDQITVQHIVEDKEYSITLGGIKKTGEGDEIEPDFNIVALDQNKAKKVSALVYLDGDIVDNTMVANAATSMTGKINLQFASSAELQPMENTAIREGGTEGGGNAQVPAEITKEQLSTAITAVKASEVYTAANAAANKTVQQTALLSAVEAAETVAAKEEPTAEEIKSAATTLAATYVLAGGTNPFAG